MVEFRALKKAAVKLLRYNVKLKRGEKVVVLTDRKNDPIYSAMLSAAEELGGVVRGQRIRSGRAPSSPIPEARKNLLWADVILAPTDSSTTHCKETAEAAKKGLRGATLPGIYPELFVKAMTIDPLEIEKANKKIVRVLTDARQVHITSPAGTDLVLYINSRPFKENGPDLSEKGKVTNVPFGETYLPPVETKGEGKLVLFSWNKKKGTVFIKGGKIVSSDAGGRKHVDHLKKAGSSGLIVAELGFGTNKAFKKPIGNILQDEKIYGTVHVAFGQNISFGGKNRAKVHQDYVILKPTVWVDGKKVLDKGKIL